MDIGKFDKRITLQSRSATLDDYGQQINSWSDVATIWANIKPISGREKLRSMAIESELTHTVAVRYDVRFLPPKTVDAWRIKYVTPAGERIFNINAARDMDEARKYIIFDCTEGSEVGQ
jgi:SPP1 family predicted phage head-tail adaptor